EFMASDPFLVSFFFSSRRRHTRCYRDWSSDVCSSDLNRYGLSFSKDWTSTRAMPRRRMLNLPSGRRASSSMKPAQARGKISGLRSEERRVGKECRAKGAGSYEKRKEVRCAGLGLRD